MMDDSIVFTNDFLREVFRGFYTSHTVGLPDRFARREYAFIYFGGRGMVRHISFHRRQDFIDYLREYAPAHVYYSSAYYQKPDASNMQEKNWMGADLIFDLDSDHLPNADRLTYTEALERVKKEFKKLVEDFLLGDFGFDKKHIELYFSGGRGYHCHVKDPDLLDMDSNERREIVDYITGKDFDDNVIFHDYFTDKKRYGGRTYSTGRTLRMPTPDTPGWKGRISRGIIDIIDEIRISDDPVNRLKEYGVKDKDAERLVKELSDERVKRIKNGFLDQSRIIKRFFLNRAIRRTAVALSAGETDEPVTCDTKRLIRLPYSLHGKTGFQVVRLSIDKLDDFNPLDDAVVLPSKPVSVTMNESFSITIKGEEYKFRKGEIDEVPLYLAVFLIGRNLAALRRT